MYATFCKTSICHFPTFRKSPFSPLTNKRAIQGSLNFGRVIVKTKFTSVFHADYFDNVLTKFMINGEGSRDGASHQCGPGSIPGLGVKYMWVEFVVGSRPCSERFFSGYSGFPLSSRNSCIFISHTIGQTHEKRTSIF